MLDNEVKVMYNFRVCFVVGSDALKKHKQTAGCLRAGRFAVFAKLYFLEYNRAVTVLQRNFSFFCNKKAFFKHDAYFKVVFFISTKSLKEFFKLKGENYAYI